MVEFLKEISKMTKRMDQVPIYLIVEICLMATGTLVFKKVKEDSLVLVVKLRLGFGRMENVFHGSRSTK